MASTGTAVARLVLSCVLFLLCQHQRLVVVVNADLVITEFLASNTAGLRDRDGEFSDWVEIHNTDRNNDVSLTGFFLTDNVALPAQWAFPTGVTLPANGYRIVFCSGKNLLNEELHTNFRLGAGGEYLALYNRATVVSSYAPTYPVQTENRSYGISSTGALRYFTIPTPGSVNGVGDTVRVAAPATASVARGFYTNPFTVMLTTNETTSPVQIRYTLNGSEPTVSTGFVYTTGATISIVTTTILRAATFAIGGGGSTLLPSPVSTYSYIFTAQVLQQPATAPGFPNGVLRDTGAAGAVPLDMAMDRQIVTDYSGEIGTAMTAIPTLSLAASVGDIFGTGTGFYLNDDEERKVSIEILHRNNPAQQNQQIDVGAESHSHNRLKRSIRLNFRTDYGNREWETTLFRDFPLNGGSATNKVRTVVLRGGNNRCWARSWNPDATTYTEDEFYRSTYLAMTGYGSHGTFVHLYLNGVYWGVYNMVERPDNDFAAGYLGGDKDNWYFRNHGGAPASVNATRWNYLTGPLANKPMSIAQNYQEMQQYLDVQGFADYMLAAFYVGLTDWPDNNWYVALRNANDPLGPTPARFYAWDGEWSLDRRQGGGDGATVPAEFIDCTDADINSAPITKLWCALRQSQDFRTLFSSRVTLHTRAGGPLSTAAATIRFDTLNAFVESAIIGESARWGDSLETLGGQFAVTRTRNEDWRDEVNIIRTLLQGNTAQLLDVLRSAGFYTPGPIAPVPAPVAAPTTVATPMAAPVPVTAAGLSLMLINSNTNADIGPLTDGMTFDLTNVGRALNVRIQPAAPPNVRSVVFNYDTGRLVRTENSAPYTLAATNWTPTVGRHTIVATAYSAGSGGGTVVGTITVAFTVVASTTTTPVVSPPALVPAPVPVVPVTVPVPVVVVPPPSSTTYSLILINAATDVDIGPLTTGMTVAIGGRSFNVRLEPRTPTGVGSVLFRYDSNPMRTENSAPYALAGDDGRGNYNSWTPTVGSHTVVATVYSRGSGTGTLLATVSVTFQVIN